LTNLFSDSKAAYIDFIQAGVDEITEKFYSRKKLSPIFGSEDRMQVIKERMDPVTKDVDCHREYNQDRLVPVIMKNVALYFTTPTDRIKHTKRGCFNYARSISALLLKELTNMTYREIAGFLEQKSPTAVKAGIFHLRKDFEKKSDIRKLYESLTIASSHLTT